MSYSLILLILFCVVMEAARELCFKRAADGVSLVEALQNWLVWLGIFFWVVELVAWVRVLEQAPLTIAYPLSALAYVAVVAGSVWILKERLTPRHVMGAALVTLGVACVGSVGI